ncbi:Cna B-type domain-containing protein [Bacillus sp. E214]|uniref:Cna B-type domain-containing protein n=1 Tax=Bacillus sp. E214 TaxID=2587156 RepID=UPI00165248C2|nr:Cna B-type domain-containing protein [Bacillus sp. E214]
MKKRTRKRAFSILTLLFLLVQTILTPVTQYVNADSTTVGISFDNPSAQEGDMLTATLTDSGEDSGTLTFSIPTGLSIKEFTEGQDNIEISNKDAQSLSFTWKEESNQVVKVQVSADTAGDYMPQLTSQNGGTQSVAIQVTSPEVTTDETEVTNEKVEATAKETDVPKEPAKVTEEETEDKDEKGTEETTENVPADILTVNELEENVQDSGNNEDSSTGGDNSKSSAASRALEFVPSNDGELADSNANLSASGDIRLPITIRDFKADGYLFEMSLNSTSGRKNMVNGQIGEDKKPVFNQNMIDYTRFMFYHNAPSLTDEQINAKLDELFNNSANNMSLSAYLPLNKNSDGTYSYHSNHFYPIDDLLFGNEYRHHNYHFSLEMHTKFTYKGEEKFTFIGDDDVWVFINGKLAIDLGGVHSEQEATIDLDKMASTLRLEKGKDYDFDFFYMERHTTQSNLKITTSIQFEPNVSAVKEVNKTEALNGDELTYKFTASNTGEKNATNVILSDTLDPGLSLVKDSVTINGNPIEVITNGNSDVKATFDESTRVLTIPIGDMAAGTEAKISFKANVSVDDSLFDSQNKYVIRNTGQIDGTDTNEVTTTITGPEKTSVKVSKVWNDANNKEKLRPEKVTVKLLADNQETGKTVELKEGNNWTATFSGLNKYKSDGGKINYTVVEADVEGYRASIIGDETDGYVLTNTLQTSVKVSKAWDDADNQDGIRPNKVTVNLLANREATGKTIELNSSTGWTATFDGLDKYAENGAEINYTVAESSVEGYEVSISGDATNGYKLTNTHKVEKIDISGKKVWEDGDNQDGKRPTSVTINLLANGNLIKTVTVTAEDNWEFTFNNLDKNANGNKIDYRLTESTVKDYSTKIDGTTIINTYTPEQTSVTVTKAWNDGQKADNLHPDKVTVKLLADGEETGETVELSPENNWTSTFTKLPVYKDGGKKITYTVAESEVEGYRASITGDANIGFVITNTEQTSVQVTKVWNDSNNKDKLRPEKVSVSLLADGDETGRTIELNGKNEWKAAFLKLDKYNEEGKEIIYTVVEEEVEGYRVSIAVNATDGYVITNTEQTEIKANKVWKDADNKDNLRPEKVTVSLLANGEETGKTIELKDTNNWEGKFYQLDKYDKDGEVITYTVAESKVDSYQVSITGDATDGYVLTNTLQTSVEVTKTWDDADDQDGIRPDEITVSLLANGVETGKTVNLNDTNNWTDKFLKLDKYNENGEVITYTVAESAVEGYEVSISGDAAKGFELTNTHEVEKTSISGKKIWDDGDNRDGKRPESVTINLLANGNLLNSVTVTAEDNWEYTFNNLDKYANGNEIAYSLTENRVEDYSTNFEGTTITNTYTPEQTSVTVTKAWNDGDNEGKHRPEEVTVSLMADGKETGQTVALNPDNNWTNTFTELNVYKDGGKKIIYTVAESDVEGYRVSITGDASQGYVITNTEQTSVKVTKVWDDADDQDGLRPEEVTVSLMADGNKTGKNIVLNGKNDWTYTFTELDKYKESGELIDYTVVEPEVPNGYTDTIAGDANEGYKVYNIHLPKQTSVKVNKTWNDADNQDGVRPDKVTMSLFADGKDTGETIELNDENNWTGVFAQLDVYRDGGQEISYTVVESNVPKGYTDTITGDAAEGFKVTNTHDPETIDVSGTKTWNDANNQDGKRPGSIMVNLLADGKKVDSKTVTEEDEWTYSFTNLPKYKVGKVGQEVEYTLTEEEVKEYKTTVNGYNITNTHTPEKIDISGTKTWDDNKDQDGKRPESITVNLLANGKKVDSVNVTPDEYGNWKYTFKNLDKYAGGKEIKYTVTEEPVPGYKETIKDFDIANSYELGSVMVNKEVTGVSEDHLDAAEFTFIITGPDDSEQEIIIPAGDSRVLKGLNPGTYTIKEVKPDQAYSNESYNYLGTSYQVSGAEESVEALEGQIVVSENNRTVVTFTNEYEPVGDLKVVKIDSADDEKVLEGAEFTLTDKDGNVQTLTTDQEGAAFFENLPYGEYELAETKAPKGYIFKEGQKWTVTIDDHSVVEMPIQNTKGTPSLEVSKTTDKQEYKQGETIHYTITVKNTGDIDLEGIELKGIFSKNGDANIGQLELEGYTGPINLKIGERATYKVDYVIPKTDLADTTYTNVIIATVDDVEISDEVTVIVDPTYALEVNKEADKEEVKVGETITYTITVTNTGKHTLTNVNVVDKMVGLDTVIEKLEAGETKTFTVTHVATAEDVGELTNVAVAKVVVNCEEIVEEGSEIVKVSEQDAPALDVEKTADKSQYKPGETVTYTITITNTGNVDLKRITLKDVFSKDGDDNIDQLKLEGYDTENGFDLAVGKTATFTATYVIPETDLADTTYTNVITATVDGVEMDPVSDEATIIVDPTYALEVDKTADKEEVKVGETITYTINVTNTGNKALTDVKVVDEMVGLDTVIEKLEVGKTKTFTVKHVATTENVGELTNVAVAKVVIDGKEIVEEGSVTVTVSEEDAAVVTPDPKEPTIIEVVQNFIENPKTGQSTLNILLVLGVFLIAGSGLYVWKRKH